VKVSILIPCYNAEKWIAQAIESALAQTYSNKEVIVVDDGSTDQSLSVIKKYADQIRFETGPNRGGNVTRNRLLELSSGEWLQYLDADDYLLPQKVENQVRQLDEDTDVLFSQCLVEYHINGSSSIQLGVIPEPHDPFILLAIWAMPQTGAPLWRKQAILDVGGWRNDQPVCQEHELYLRLLIHERKFKFYPQAESVYRLWSESTLWKKDQSFTRMHRLTIEERLEKHLIEKKIMTYERQYAINMAKFEIARLEWEKRPEFSISIINSIKQDLGRFLPKGKSAPLKYRLIYALFGFNVAQKIARIFRRDYK
jgi:glycosyltransferase involved in cell wall biosynthesis